MREIKFRAWDKVTNIMAEVTGFKNGYTDGSIGIWYINRDGEENLCKPQKADIELMQYTGLNDKNGTEIYEGDIVNCIEYKCYGKIEWNEEEAGFYFYTLFEDGGYQEERLYDYVEELWVIGNIYENPELLEGRE